MQNLLQSKMDVLNGPCRELSYLLKKCFEHADTMGMGIFRSDFSVTQRKFRIFFIMYNLYIIMVTNTITQAEDDLMDVAFACATIGFVFQVGWIIGIISMTANQLSIS